jgi:hypothetical protein
MRSLIAALVVSSAACGPELSTEGQPDDRAAQSALAAALKGPRAMLRGGPARASTATVWSGTTPSPSLTVASAASPFTAGCTGGPEGDVYPNAEVEPTIVFDSVHQTLVAAWQEDRFASLGGSRGLINAYSTNGGATWTRVTVPFSRCTGGTPSNKGDWERATNTQLTVSPNGTVFQIALPFNTGPGGSVAVSRSQDGGRTWSAIIQLKVDNSGQVVNDKPTITADPNDWHYVYATWHRLDFHPDPAHYTQWLDPTWFARSTNGGATWEPAVQVYDPGLNGDTLYDQIAVLPNGDLVLGLTHWADGNTDDVRPMVLRSTDHGLTWSQPIFIDGVIPSGGVVTFPVTDPTTGAPIRALATFFIAADSRPTSRTVYAAYLDNRGGTAHVSLSRSTDGGRTWSAPARINKVATAEAFPQWLTVNSSGAVAVLYDDFRYDTSDPAVLQTSAFLSTCAGSSDCSKASNWSEHQVGSTFNLLQAPNTNLGYALGDAQSVVGAPCGFTPSVVLTNASSTNPTDVFVGCSP